MQTGKYFLKQAYKQFGNEKALDYLITFGFIKSKKDLDADLFLPDEEISS